MDQIKIGQYIAECRKSKGLTQKSLAEQLLVSDKAVSKWERGICLPNIELLVPLCEILEVSINSLLIGEDKSPHLEDKPIVEVVQLYGNEARRKERTKTIIIALSIIVLIFAVAILPLYAKYSSSSYNVDAQNTWIRASTSIIETLDLLSYIESENYNIDKDTYYKLEALDNQTIEDLLNFQSNTKKGEKVNALSKEAQTIVSDVFSGIQLNAQKSLINDNKTYVCNKSEISMINDLLMNLLQIHDNINKEMRINSPGISSLY